MRLSSVLRNARHPDPRREFGDVAANSGGCIYSHVDMAAGILHRVIRSGWKPRRALRQGSPRGWSEDRHFARAGSECPQPGRTIELGRAVDTAFDQGWKVDRQKCSACGGDGPTRPVRRTLLDAVESRRSLSWSMIWQNFLALGFIDRVGLQRLKIEPDGGDGRLQLMGDGVDKRIMLFHSSVESRAPEKAYSNTTPAMTASKQQHAQKRGGSRAPVEQNPT